jgi:hypothetical protein
VFRPFFVFFPGNAAVVRDVRNTVDVQQKLLVGHVAFHHVARLARGLAILRRVSHVGIHAVDRAVQVLDVVAPALVPVHLLLDVAGAQPCAAAVAVGGLAAERTFLRHEVDDLGVREGLGAVSAVRVCRIPRVLVRLVREAFAFGLDGRSQHLLRRLLGTDPETNVFSGMVYYDIFRGIILNFLT